MYHLFQTDITQINVDAIVNAANTELLRGHGVCGAIFNKAGFGLDAECLAYVKDHGKVPTGQAVLTGSYNLNHVKHIIHAVGPIYQDGKHNEDQLLASAYYESVKLAFKNNLKSIAFPFISSGIYGYPIYDCAMVGHKALTDMNTMFPEMNIIMCVFSNADFDVWNKIRNN